MMDVCGVSNLGPTIGQPIGATIGPPMGAMQPIPQPLPVQQAQSPRRPLSNLSNDSGCGRRSPLSPEAVAGAYYNSLLQAKGLSACNLGSNLGKVSTYSSPAPLSSTPENNICKLIDYRGAKVAAFVVDGSELICLPQAFELFLKHLVGGLHTVYTKLKRLDVVPVVCNVEQVRILRGLGAIQPGVNRCKLLSCRDFDILYEDCTNSSARPGRPPKRASMSSPHSLEKLKKSGLDGDFHFDPRIYAGHKTNPIMNGFPHNPYAMGALPFMPFAAHHMFSPPTSMALTSHLALRNEAAAVAAMKERPHVESDLMSSRVRDERSDAIHRHYDKGYTMVDSTEDTYRHMTQTHNHHQHHDIETKPLNLNINNQGAVDLIKPKPIYDNDDIDDDEDDGGDVMSDDDKDDDVNSTCTDPSEPSLNPVSDRMDTQTSASNAALVTQLLNGDIQGISSVETLLLNIQGLLKVAADNARHHDRQYSMEKADLKLELLREREVREKLEKQLHGIQETRVMLSKRLKREKRVRRRLQEQLQASDIRRDVMSDESPKASPPPSHADSMRLASVENGYGRESMERSSPGF